MSGKLVALASFIVMSIVVMGLPAILGLAKSRRWAIVEAMQRRPRALHVAQAVAMSILAVTGLFAKSEIKWLIVGLGTLGAVAAVLQAVPTSRSHRDV
jgi:hypothetical protein